jgi:hypothetical protein
VSPSRGADVRLAQSRSRCGRVPMQTLGAGVGRGTFAVVGSRPLRASLRRSRTRPPSSAACPSRWRLPPESSGRSTAGNIRKLPASRNFDPRRQRAACYLGNDAQRRTHPLPLEWCARGNLRYIARHDGRLMGASPDADVGKCWKMRALTVRGALSSSMTLPADSGRAAADNGESLRRFRASLRGTWCLAAERHT